MKQKKYNIEITKETDFIESLIIIQKYLGKNIYIDKFEQKKGNKTDEIFEEKKKDNSSNEILLS